MKEHSLALKTVEGPSLKPEPEFPKDSFKGPLREMADATANTHGIDPPICFATGLAAVSAAMGKSYLASNGSNHPPTCGNLYLLGSAPPSAGKGVVTGCILKPLYDWDKTRDAEFLEDLPKMKAKLEILNAKKNQLLKKGPNKKSEFDGDVASIQAEIDSITDDGKSIRNPPPMIVENISSEALAIALEQAGGALFSNSSEASDLIAIAKGRYSEKGNDFAIPLDFRRVSRLKVKVPNPRLVLLWMAQPIVVNELLHDKVASLQGLTARFLFVPAKSLLEPEKLEPRNLPEEVRETWQELLEKILRFREGSESPLEVPCSQEARSRFLDFHNETNQSMKIRMIAYANELGKAREQAIRVALDLAVAEHPKAQPEEINASQAERAIDLVKWCQGQLIKEIGTHRAKSLADRANALEKQLVDKYLDEGCTVRDMSRLHGFDKEEIEEIVGCFQDRFELHEKKPQTGRSSTLVRLRMPRAA